AGAVGFMASPLLSPQVKDVVQVDVGEQRGDHRPLGRTGLTRTPLSILYHSSLQPLANQSNYARIPDPMLDETHPPLVAERIEKDRRSTSRIQFTFVRQIPTASASSASCWLRPGRKPYENPRKSCS